jgi:hypothetical protein
MNPAVRLPRIHPWIVVALVVALVLLIVTALTLVVVEPGILRAIGTALHGPQQMAPVCAGTPSDCH